MPIVRHFLLKVDAPAAARKLLGRLVSGDEADAPQITTAKDWHVGFEPGPGDDPAEPPRRKPDYCLNLGITWPGLLALEVKDRVPNLSFKSFNAFVAGAAARAELVGDTGDEWAAELDRRLRDGKRSRHADAACREPGGPEDLQRPAVRADRRGPGFPGNLARRRDGADGDAGRQAGTRSQGPLRLRRRHQHDDDSRRARSATSPITSSRASPGCSSCWTRPRITSCRSLRNWGAMAVSPSSR